ncbi:hypothetical protein SUDANB1_06867 [Streptomyces sp. enrichment culture]
MGQPGFLPQLPQGCLFMALASCESAPGVNQRTEPSSSFLAENSNSRSASSSSTTRALGRGTGLPSGITTSSG